MSENNIPAMTPTEFIAVTNQTLEYAYSSVVLTGEVASFKINQGKWVFFDLKDESSSVSCFMTLWDLRMPIEDGMKVIVRGTPKVTKWGKFSFTVAKIQPVGEGSLKKSFEMLKKKLEGEGLFNPEKKREIPKGLSRIGVISSTQAAGYADFIKILNARWGGIKVLVAHTQVQGMDAPEQIIRALRYFNERSEVEAIVIIRGGGSADDLSCFNDEKLVREIAGSKIPVMTGIGHEVDESLADLAADVRASTPSNAAELLTYDKKVENRRVKTVILQTGTRITEVVSNLRRNNTEKVRSIADGLKRRFIEPRLEEIQVKMRRIIEKIMLEFSKREDDLKHRIRMLEILNPEKVLEQGYAILAGKMSPGEEIEIITFEKEIKAKIKEVYERKK
ncbi:exodeoxyribonuclease VII large subunit [Candidatus Saccharibacteria bacterium]|nr:exodeoxyribonuclease VII large subunit [Candidatus Saccharibacteria bacterium]